MENYGKVWVQHWSASQDSGAVQWDWQCAEGSLCAPFRAHRGIQQGCALSRMLYALSLESLLHMLHLCVQGLVVPGFNSNVDQCDVDADIKLTGFELCWLQV